jgi:hypothetical protein
MACNYICDKVCDKYTDEDIALSLVQTEVEISEIIRYVQHNLTNIVVCIPMCTSYENIDSIPITCG